MTAPRTTAKKPKAKLPQHVIDGMESRSGQLIGQRAARVHTCPTCHSPIFRGLDADTCALEASADVNPLDAGGELAALLTGRRTYRLSWTTHRASPRYELDRRDRWQIAGSAADPTGGVEVVAEHRCGQPLATGYATDRKAAAAAQLPDSAPF